MAAFISHLAVCHCLLTLKGSSSCRDDEAFGGYQFPEEILPFFVSFFAELCTVQLKLFVGRSGNDAIRSS